jgi:hypothetical protein
VSEIAEKLPRLVTVSNVLDYLSNTFEVKGNCIKLHNKAFYDSVVNVLNRNIKHYIVRDEIEEENVYISDYYSSLYDFEEQKDTVILSGSVDPVVGAGNPNDRYKITNSITPKDSQSEIPIVYVCSRNPKIIYLVQSTALGKIGSAVRVCKAWKESGINIGYEVFEAERATDYNIVIYSLLAGSIVEHQYIKGKSAEYTYEVVMYDDVGTKNPRYGALLRLSQLN